MAFSTPARSRRPQARFARFNNETKRRQELSQAAGLQWARCLARPPAEIFRFPATFPGSWSGAFHSLCEGWLKKTRKGLRKHFSPKVASKGKLGPLMPISTEFLRYLATLARQPQKLANFRPSPFKPIEKVRGGGSPQPSLAGRRLLARSNRTKRFLLASLCQGNRLGAKGVRPQFPKF